MREGNVFSLSPPGWGYPGQVQTGGCTPTRSDGVYPSQGVPAQGTCRPGQDGEYPSQGAPTQGTPPSDLARGYPTMGTPPVQDNRWSTWYAAVGMPLAFTREDFLVLRYILAFNTPSLLNLQYTFSVSSFTSSNWNIPWENEDTVLFSPSNMNSLRLEFPIWGHNWVPSFAYWN